MSANMKRDQTVCELEVSTLIRLWFRLLWQKYDHGGISVGRSLRCDLLDCYLDFTPIPDLVYNADDYYEDLEDEILGRTLVEPQYMFSIESIAEYSEPEIALAGLGGLLALEFSVDADTAFNNGYELERKRIKEVLRHFKFIAIPSHMDINLVVKTLLERKRDIECQRSIADFNTPYVEPVFTD